MKETEIYTLGVRKEVKEIADKFGNTFGSRPNTIYNLVKVASELYETNIKQFFELLNRNKK